MSVTFRGGGPKIFISTGNPISGTLTGAWQPQAGDQLLLYYGNDYYGIGAMPTPSIGGSTTGVTAITNGSSDAGTPDAHVIAYVFDVASTGDLTISATESAPGDEDKGLWVWVLNGAAAAASQPDGGSSGAAGSHSSGSAQSSFVFTGVSPTGSDAWLVYHMNSGGGSSAGPPFGTPSGMTQAYSAATGGISYTGGYQQLSASGATGTRTVTAGAGSITWAGVLIAIKTSSGSPAVVWLPNPSPRRRPPLRVSRARGIAPPRVQAPQPPAGQARRVRLPVLRPRGRTVAPVRAQVNPPFPINQQGQPRRIRGMQPRRGRAVLPPWPQQAAAVNPTWVASARRPRQVPEILRRVHAWMPPWPQQAAAVAPSWVAPSRRPRPLPEVVRRSRVALPALAAPSLLPAGRRRLIELPARRVRPVGPPLPAAPALPVPRRPRLILPAARPRQSSRLVLASVAAPANPSIVLVQSRRRLLVMPALRRGRVFAIPLIGATAPALGPDVLLVLSPPGARWAAVPPGARWWVDEADGRWAAGPPEG